MRAVSGPAEQDAGAVALAAARHLAAQVGESGQFRMGYDPETGRTVPGYNMVRHAAAVWTMAEVAAATGSAEIAEAAGRALDWALARRLHVLPGGAACITEGKGQAKLGTAGLMIAALAAHGGAGGDGLDTARSLARFVQQMQKRSGDFHNLLDTATGRPVRRRSAHYVGEALLGLLRLARWSGEPEWRALAEEVIRTLSQQKGAGTLHSHWMLYAIAELPEDMGELAGFAGRIVAGLTRDTAYRARQECVPLACRVEARALYLSLLRRAGDPAAALRSVEAELRTDAQLLLGLRGPDGSFRKAPGNRLVQIDQLQHAAAAFLRLHELGLPAVPASPTP